MRAAAYYFNRAAQWGKEVTFATKDVAYLAGSVQDFEKQQRAPRWIYPPAWQVDDSLGSTWGYTDGMTYRPADNVLRELIELASQGGNLMLNISPMGDGSIPEAQQKILITIGEWLRDNGEGIYDSRPWIRYGEGPGVPSECPPDWKGGSTANQTDSMKGRPHTPITEADFRFTVANGKMYAFGYKYPATNASIRSLNSNAAHVERVTLLGSTPVQVQFRQTSEALVISMPPAPESSMPYALRIEGSQSLA